MLVAIGLQLPAPTPPAQPAGQSVPPPITAPATPAPGQTNLPAAPAAVPAPSAPAKPPAPFTLAWTKQVESTTELSLAISARFIFTAGEGAPLEARWLGTGDTVWTSPQTSWHALVAGDDLVFGVTGDRLLALDAATGAPRWSASPVGLNPRLTVWKDRILVATDAGLQAHDLAGGAVLWTAGLESPPATAPVAGELRVLLGLTDGSIVSFEHASGARHWRVSVGAAPLSLLAGEPQIYFSLPDGNTCALRAADAQLPPAWCFDLRIQVAGDLLVDDRYLYLALFDNSLRALDRNHGAIERIDKLGYRPGSGPQVAGSYLAIPLSNGDFVLLDRDGRLASRLSPGPSQSFERAAVRADGSALVSLNILVGGGRSLHAYLPTSPAAAPEPAPSPSLAPPDAPPAAPEAPKEVPRSAPSPGQGTPATVARP